MQFDPAEFQKHYASLSDDALLEIDREQLVAVAQQVYDDELAQRGITFETEAAPEPEAAVAVDEWVLAAAYANAEEANLALNMLQSAAIPSRLASNNTSAWSGTGEINLLVPQEMLSEAEFILGSPISDEDLIAQAEAEAPPDGADEG
jgi:hypothetical protein